MQNILQLPFGTFSTEELISTAIDKGVPSLALTNINSTCDLWEFVKLANAAGIKPIAGVEVRNDDQLLYILLAANNKGLTSIHRFLSEHLVNKKPFLGPVDGSTFFENPADGFVVYPLGTQSFEDLAENERIGILPWEVNKLHSFNWKNHKEKLVIRQPVTFQNKKYFNLHRLLRSISKNCLLSQLPEGAQASQKEVFVYPSQLLKSFEQFPFIITNTYQLMDACNVSIDFTIDKNKQCYSASKKDDKVLLFKLAHDGFLKTLRQKEQDSVGEDAKGVEDN